MVPKKEPIRFKEPATAQIGLARIKDRLGAGSAAPLESLLRQSADPDGVVTLLQGYTEITPPESLAEIGRRPRSLAYLTAAFAQGSLLSEAFLAEPTLVLQFVRDRSFASLRSSEDLMEDYARFSATDLGRGLPEKLAHFKRRNYARIALKDVLGMATLAETTLELSALADVILAEALREADRELGKRYGQPQYRDALDRRTPSGFSVVSLGKLGGNELNYSSDIDLLFIYARDGETSGTGSPETVLSNREYFTKLAQAVAATLTEPTPSGRVFRVDLRLRPEGDQGDLTLSLAAALDYYARRARDWELQMLIKARHSAGDARLTRAFLQGVDSRIYSSPANIEAVRSIIASRERISQRLQAGRKETLDVKLHPGGIRDIELLTQCLQRLYGAREPWVRSGGTLHALRKLNDKTLISDRDYAALTSAYQFLRKVEHRIQLERGRQTHRLPSSHEALERLARRSGIESDHDKSPGQLLLSRLEKTMNGVGEIYDRLLNARVTDRSPERFELKPVAAGLDAARQPYPVVLNRLERQAPEVAAIVRQSHLPARVQPRLTQFLAALTSSNEALAAACEQPAAIERALGVLSVSDYLSDLLARYPKDVAGLAQAPPQPASSTQMSIGLEPRSSGTPAGFQDANEAPDPDRGCDVAPARPFSWVFERQLNGRDKMALLRQTYRAQLIQLSARDCTELIEIYPALGSWSTLAASAVATAFSLAAQESQASASREPESAPGRDNTYKKGQAGTVAMNNSVLPEISVLALGRMGLREFDLGSDADLVFVVNSGATGDQIPAGVRVVERLIESLSSYTRDGAVFAVDTRLRPRGSEGELVVTEDALLEYASGAAQPWEALTYLKMCPVAGSAELGNRVVKRLAQRLFDRFADDSALRAALLEMRRRLEKESRPRGAVTKSAPGGYYDVDFSISYLRLRHRVMLAAGSNMLEQITALADAEKVSRDDRKELMAGGSFLRALDHAQRLVKGRASRGLPERPGHVEGVEQLLRLWGFMAQDRTESFQDRLAEAQGHVRAQFDRIFGL